MDSSTKVDKKWDSISVRAEHDIPGKLKRLAAELSRELGVGIHQADAVGIAVREALKRRGVEA